MLNVNAGRSKMRVFERAREQTVLILQSHTVLGQRERQIISGVGVTRCLLVAGHLPCRGGLWLLSVDGWKERKGKVTEFRYIGMFCVSNGVCLYKRFRKISVKGKQVKSTLK